MTGRASFWCWLAGHAEAMWHVREHGSGWECPDCLRFRASAVLPPAREVQQ